MSTISQVQIGSTTYDLFDPSIRTEISTSVTSARGIFTSETDADSGSNNAVALSVGKTTGTHLEFDGNEILAKTNASTQGTLNLNLGGTVALSNTSGTVTAGGTVLFGPSVTANTVWAAPNGSAGKPSMRALVAADIPNLAASKITSGTFDTARIPNLAASKITSGTFDAARIPNLATSKITDLGDIVTSNPDAVSVKTETWTTLGNIALTAGVWVIAVSVTTAANANGRRVINFNTSSTSTAIGVTAMGAGTFAPANGAMSKYSNIHIGSLTGSTTYYCRLWQNSGSTLSCQCYLRAVKIK